MSENCLSKLSKMMEDLKATDMRIKWFKVPQDAVPWDS
jgi:hypothetical protein